MEKQIILTETEYNELVESAKKKHSIVTDKSGNVNIRTDEDVIEEQGRYIKHLREISEEKDKGAGLYCHLLQSKENEIRAYSRSNWFMCGFVVILCIGSLLIQVC